MRPFLIFTFFLFIGTFGFSQDVILKRDGKKIEAKVLEVSSTQIKYKREDQQDGPLRTIPVYDVKEIIYEDGTWDTFDQEGPGETPKNETGPPEPRTKAKDHILGNGFFLDGMICYAMGSEMHEISVYDPITFNYTYTTESVLRNYIGINIRLGHKWYFGSSEKWRPGIQATWARIGVFFAPDITDYSPKFTLSLLNAGFANAIKFNDDNGMEANANVGFTMNGIPLPGSGSTPDIGIIYSAEVKFRHKAFAVGIDFSRINLNIGYADRSSLNVIALTVGFKM